MGRTFQTQGEAETWLGEFYPSLLRAGVRAVSLYEARPAGVWADVFGA